MFLPRTQSEQNDNAASEATRRKAYSRIEDWAKEAIPKALRKGVQISVQEVQCGDPNCAPIDTAIAILFPSGGRGMMGLPMEAKDVTRENLISSFPTEDVLTAWHKGEEAEWPPYNSDDEDDDEWDDEQQRPPLRFDVGQKVECRIGPDPITGWAPGKIIQLWYREPGWPPNSWAPYQIQLDDGRTIFAPGDVDQIIRKKG